MSNNETKEKAKNENSNVKIAESETMETPSENSITPTANPSEDSKSQTTPKAVLLKDETNIDGVIKKTDIVTPNPALSKADSTSGTTEATPKKLSKSVLELPATAGATSTLSSLSFNSNKESNPIINSNKMEVKAKIELAPTTGNVATINPPTNDISTSITDSNMTSVSKPVNVSATTTNMKSNTAALASSSSSSVPPPSNTNMPKSTTADKSEALKRTASISSNASKSGGISISTNWEQYKKRFLNHSDLSMGLAAAQELRERIEIVHSTEYSSILKHLLEPFTTIITIRTRPNPNPESVEHLLRRTILEIISRFPQNEVLKPHAISLVRASMTVLRMDYEENALIASRIVFDLHKAYRPFLMDHVQLFLDFVHSSYKELPISAKTNFMTLRKTMIGLTMSPRPTHKPQMPPSQPYRPPGAPNPVAPIPTSNPLGLKPPSTAPPIPISSGTTQTKTFPAGVSNPPISSIPNTAPIRPSPQQPQQVPSNFPPKTIPPSSSPVPVTSTLPSTAPKPTQPTPPVPSVSAKAAIAAASASIKSPLKSISSFRVLTECPLTVMLLFQLYPRYINKNIRTLIPLMMDSLSLPPPPPLPQIPQSQHQQQQQQQQQQPNLQKEQIQIQQQTQRIYFLRSRELVACQVKTLSFLTYLLRGFTDQMKPHEGRIAHSVVQLMKTCPSDSISTRKELLVATRHILAIEHFRKGFYRHVDTMLDERVLFGTHRHTEQSILRPLGYSTLADLIHHARSELSFSQMPRIVLIFSRVIHDSTLPAAIQTTSVRLLLNLLDHVMKNNETTAHRRRDLLVRIFDTLVHKFDSLRTYIPLVTRAANEKLDKDRTFERACLGSISLKDKGNCVDIEKKRECISAEMDIDGENKSVQSMEKDILQPCRPHSLGGKPDTKDSIQDIQSLIKSMISGLKTVIWCLGNSRSQVNIGSSVAMPGAAMIAEDRKAANQKLTQTELDLVSTYMEWGLECMCIFKESELNLAVSSNLSSTQKKTTRIDKGNAKQMRKKLSIEFFERFAASFTVLDGFSLRKAIGPKMSLIFDSIIEDENFISIPQHLISNREVSTDFCDVLLHFFIERINDLAVPCQETTQNTSNDSASKADLKQKKAYFLLRLFKIMLQSLSIYPENEAILRTKLQTIVALCLRSATQNSESWPGYYFSVLRVLFRAVSVGKFEKSYKELLPLLPTILNGLWRIHSNTSDNVMKNAIVELCLTTPARLSSLLPHIPLLLRLIVDALRSQHGDLINLGYVFFSRNFFLVSHLMIAGISFLKKITNNAILGRKS